MATRQLRFRASLGGVVLVVISAFVLPGLFPGGAEWLLALCAGFLGLAAVLMTVGIVTYRRRRS